MEFVEEVRTATNEQLYLHEFKKYIKKEYFIEKYYLYKYS